MDAKDLKLPQEFKLTENLEDYHEMEHWGRTDSWVEIVPESGRKNDYIQNGLDYNDMLIKQLVENKDLDSDKKEQVMDLLRENLQKMSKAANSAIERGNTYKKSKRR
ncbi:unnamed protein product [Moneuplotes crassus]|uniref:Uncharacterized protein n=2 Tax=Euplotes crassus TaxID=5936 RepID=A0AAD1Y8B1_EUPCR|nr:unnamed protein product [Moneuplotes crassus]